MPQTKKSGERKAFKKFKKLNAFSSIFLIFYFAIVEVSETILNFKDINNNMFYGYFSIIREKVQQIGFRPFLTLIFLEYNLDGKAWNSSLGNIVEVEVWGKKQDIERFYNDIRALKLKPKGAKPEFVSKISLKKSKGPNYLKVISYNQYLMYQQLSKGIEVQKKIPEKLQELINLTKEK